jgi:glutamate/aspartate transport system substrate-binding protein
MKAAIVQAMLAIAAVVFAHVSEAQTQELTGVLKRVKDSGEITLGVRDSSVPFSYLDQNQQPVGYSVDLCLRVVDAVKAELKLPTLKVIYNPVTSANRIPLIANGTVEIECGSTVNNVERQQQVAFSDTTFIVSTKFVAKRANNLKTLAALKGKTVVCTAGTNTLARVNGLNQKNNLGMTILTAKDHAESFLYVETDRAVAFFEDDILLNGLVANARNPADYALSTEGYSIDPYALMLPRGDPAFKRVVDRMLVDVYKSGGIYPIYDKWFAKPIPPRGVTLNFPLSPALKRAFEKPTDSPEPAAYE